jgi:hypothetical protein
MIRRQENSLKACLYDISEGLYVGCAALAFHPCQFKKTVEEAILKYVDYAS